MKWQFEIIENNILEARLTEQFSVKEMVLMLGDIRKFDGWNNKTPILFNNTNIVLKAVTTRMMIDSVHIIKSFSHQNNLIKIACLVKGDLAFGFARQFHSISILTGGMPFMLFKDRLLSVGWLLTN